MSETSPLAAPTAWNLVAKAYAEELLPVFTWYADSALERVGLRQDSCVLDVATGPGTLALLAAPRVKEVVGIDFADGMLEVAKRRARELEIANVDFRRGDGQSLPLDDSEFDLAFSMFGLMFFPDRAAGFRELRRVLRPGGVAVVSSWTPAEESPLLSTLFAAIRKALPTLPFGKGEGPLSRAQVFAEEMASAGFHDVAVERVEYSTAIQSVEEFWRSQVRASAPLALVREKLSAAEWEEFSETVLEELRTRFGEGPLEYGWAAYLGCGRR